MEPYRGNNERGLQIAAGGNGVQNLYWARARVMGQKGETHSYEFVFPAGVESEVAWRLAPQVAELVVGASAIDCVVHPWESLPSTKQEH